jgi:predicted HicB family RNase H-like nuclease
MNINIELPDELHKKLKIDAAVNSKTIKQLIIEYLQGEVK